jgi:hypothetical protein
MLGGSDIVYKLTLGNRYKTKAVQSCDSLFTLVTILDKDTFRES